MGTYFGCVGYPERTGSRLGYLEHAKDDDLVRNGWQYLDGRSYGINSYARPALALRTLESYLGAETMARVMRTYQQRWRYRHPSTRDFIDVVNEISGQDMNWFFDQFFYSSNVADYEVSDISSEPVVGKAGVYDEDGKRNTYLEQDAAKLAEKSKSKLYRSTVVVRRLGEALAPVDVVIRFDNGEAVERSWDGKYRWVKFVFEKPSKVTSAEVDPQRKLALEANFTNNSRLAEPDNRAAAKWYIRWIFWLENLFFAAGFFS
jgi:aminopeptidase N